MPTSSTSAGAASQPPASGPRETSYDLIVVGAGPVGLAAGLLAEHWGLRTLVVERKTERSTHPKARGVRLRATELLRRWGVLDALLAQAAPPSAMRLIYCDSLAGQEYGRTSQPGGDPSVSPVRPCRVPQDVLEGELDRRVAKLTLVELRYGCELISFEAGDAGVRAVVREDGTDTEVSAGYLIAADGVASSVRRALGVQLRQQAAPLYWQSLLWRADLADLTADRPCIMFFTTAVGDEEFVGIGSAGGDRWITTRTVQPPTGGEATTLDDDAALALIRTAVGLPALEVDILSSATFRVSADVAPQWRQGRVFLAGDAAHVLPPTGGFGINTGFADVDNLLWKLAFVHRGWASPALLDTYTEERRPVAESNARWADDNGQRLTALHAAIEAGDGDRLTALLGDQDNHVSPIEQDLGFVYAQGAVAGGSLAGARAPHAEIDVDGARMSVLDLLGTDFVLLSPAAAWLHAAEEVSARLGVPVRRYRVGSARFAPVDDRFSQRYQITGTGAVLIRPDGHVAWQASTADDPEVRLAEALHLILARNSNGEPAHYVRSTAD